MKVTVVIFNDIVYGLIILFSVGVFFLFACSLLGDKRQQKRRRRQQANLHLHRQMLHQNAYWYKSPKGTVIVCRDKDWLNEDIEHFSALNQEALQAAANN